MRIYRCQLTLLEATFFSSREVSNTYYTEPCIGNIALAYALNFCRAPYFNDGTIHYRAHLSHLNEQGIYITPGTIIGQPRFTLSQFNAQPDAYWYAMANNTIVTRPDGTWAEKVGAAWYIKERQGEKGKKVGLENRPQHGRIRALSIGNQASCYIISQEPVHIPSYIRLGKFMSKARVEVAEQTADIVEGDAVVPFLFNPADLPPTISLSIFDLLSIPPTPLIRNAHLNGQFYQLPQQTFLPLGMRFGVESLPDNA
jgi:CRISPR-associated protein Csc1